MTKKKKFNENERGIQRERVGQNNWISISTLKYWPDFRRINLHNSLDVGSFCYTTMAAEGQAGGDGTWELAIETLPYKMSRWNC